MGIAILSFFMYDVSIIQMYNDPQKKNVHIAELILRN